MRTNNINYTRLTNTRDIPPAGLGGKTPDIGFGLPNYTTDTLPSAEISRPGDMVFDTTLMQPLYFDGTSYVALYPPAPPPPPQPQVYASIRQTATATATYESGILSTLTPGAIDNIVAPVGITVGGAAPTRLTNTSGAPITFIVNSSITLHITDVPALPAAISLSLLKSPAINSGTSSYFFNYAFERRAFLLSSIIELDVDEYIEVYLNSNTGAGTVDVTVEQFNFTISALPLSYGGLQSGAPGVDIAVTANVPRLLIAPSLQSLPFNGIIPNSDRLAPRLTNNTGDPINVNIYVTTTLVHTAAAGEEPFEVKMFIAKNSIFPTPLVHSFSTEIIKVIPEQASITNFYLTDTITLLPTEWASIAIVSDQSTTLNNAAFYFTMVMV